MNLQSLLASIEKKFVESGAALEHDRWARWQNYMFSKGTVDADGVFHLPKEFVDRWFRQIATSYSALSESEKESDRKETRDYLPLIKQSHEEIIQAVVEDVQKRIVKEINIAHSENQPTSRLTSLYVGLSDLKNTLLPTPSNN